MTNPPLTAEAIKSLERKAKYSSVHRHSYLRVKAMIESHERRDSAGTPICGEDGLPMGGTGATILKFEESPVARLINSKNIGNEETQAADDIKTAFHSIAGGLMIKPQELERKDKSHSEYESTRLIAAQNRYQEWARYWSKRKARGCKLLEIVIASVIDERAFHYIDGDLGMRHGKAKKALICGLRDYAARAGWADSKLSPQWIATAESVFVLRDA
jgi:hypothetical protein